MLLTIGMIVKNEERYLRGCLEALQPILDRVDSELIIADTGSTDSTIEIARAFTDNVFHFEWCDDFSAARNSTLEKARGEWYMSMDADEIFRDVDSIIDFFVSGEYKEYNSATIVIQSPNNEDGTVYSEIDSLRLVKRSVDTWYRNRIHETVPYHAPTRKLPAVADHYGYLTENNAEFIREKSDRNLKLLFLELEKDPSNCKYYLEIGQTYELSYDYDTALEYLNKGLQYAKEQDYPQIRSFYADIARIRFSEKNFSDLLLVTKEYFNLGKGKNAIDLQMYYLEARSYYGLLQYEEAVSSYKKYIKAFKKYHEGGYRSGDSIEYIIRFKDDYHYRVACLNLAHSCLEIKSYDSAGRFLELTPVSDWKEDENGMLKRLALEVNLMGGIGDYSGLPALLGQMEGKALTLLQTMLEQIESGPGRDLILKAFSGSDLEETDYAKLLKLRYAFYCTDTLAKSAAEACIGEIREWTPLYADAIYLALNCGVDALFLASRISPYDLETLFLSSKFLHFGDLAELIFKVSKNPGGYRDAGSQLWLSFLYLWAINSGKLTEDQTVALFHAYASASGAYLNAAYKGEFLTEENLPLLPKELRIGYCCSLAENCLKNGDDGKYVGYLKKMLRLYPEFAGVIKILVEDFQKRFNAETAKEKETLYEMERYAAVVKQNIEALIGNGELDQAASILSSYEELRPDDADVAALKERIRLGKKLS